MGESPMTTYVTNAKGERIAVLDVNETTGEQQINSIATAMLNDPKNKRKAAYIAEADPIRAEADGLKDRAEMYDESGESDAAGEARAERQRILRDEWLPKILEIQERYPDGS